MRDLPSPRKPNLNLHRLI